MSLDSPALQRAQAQLTARREARGISAGGYAMVGRKRHAGLRLAYSPAGQNAKGPWLYFLVRYCPDCRRGTVLDLVRAVPAGTPNAQELGIMRARTWRTSCDATLDS